jgi:hypothetical protein
MRLRYKITIVSQRRRLLAKRINFGILNQINAVQFSCGGDPGFTTGAGAALPTLHEAARHL